MQKAGGSEIQADEGCGRGRKHRFPVSTACRDGISPCKQPLLAAWGPQCQRLPCGSRCHTGTDNLISRLSSCNGNLKILLTQQNWQQTLLFQLWVSTMVCNQYKQIRQQETTGTLLAALTSSVPSSLSENS